MKRLLIIGGIFILIASVVAYITRARPAAPGGPVPTGGPTQSAPRQISFRDIVPGTTTKHGVVQELGAPIREDVDGQTTTLVYPAGLDTRALVVDIEQTGTVGRVVEPLADTTPLAPLIQNLPRPPLTLYGAHFQAGYELRVYLDHGIAVLANPLLGRARERWFFPPTTRDLFITTYAQGYSPTPPAENQE